MLNELLFWLHILIIFAALLIGLVLPLSGVIFLILLHRLHMRVFNGCLLTFIKKWLKAMPQELDFLQYASQKLFKTSLSPSQSTLTDYTISALTLLIAVAKSLS